jgi:hypothetical protein
MLDYALFATLAVSAVTFLYGVCGALSVCRK